LTGEVIWEKDINKSRCVAVALPDQKLGGQNG